MYVKYQQEVSKYGEKDTKIALCTYLITGVIVIAFWVAVDTFDMTGPLGSTVNFVVVPAIFIGMVFAIVLIKKQGLTSIGFHKGISWPRFRFGLLLALIFLTFGIAPGLIYGWEFNNLRTIISTILTTFILAAFEDIYFIGYLQPRLYGRFKNDVPAIFVGAILMVLFHIPVGLFNPTDVSWFSMIVSWSINYLIMVLIFRKYFSIVHVFIFHTFVNFLTHGRLWIEFDPEYSIAWGTTAWLIILLLVVILEIVRYYRARNAVSSQQN